MRIIGSGNETFLLLNGISVRHAVQLDEHLQIQPADTSHLDLASAIAACSLPDDIAVVAAFIPRITSQFRVSSESPRDTAAIAWNSGWDALLLSAVFQTEVGFNLQSDTSAEKITASSNLRAIHRNMSGFNDAKAYELTDDDENWIAQHYSAARRLLKIDSFQTAVQCLATHHWHPNPRIKMAIIWAGIEGIFGVQSEIRFRLSVCLARFLFPDRAAERQSTFELVKRLYDYRSRVRTH